MSDYERISLTTRIIEESTQICEYRNLSGHSLVVKHVLAKDEIGVRFSLAAQSENPKQKESRKDSFCLGQLGTKVFIVGITDTSLILISFIYVVYTYFSISQC